MTFGSGMGKCLTTDHDGMHKATCSPMAYFVVQQSWWWFNIITLKAPQLGTGASRTLHSVSHMMQCDCMPIQEPVTVNTINNLENGKMAWYSKIIVIKAVVILLMVLA